MIYELNNVNAEYSVRNITCGKGTRHLNGIFSLSDINHVSKKYSHSCTQSVKQQTFKFFTLVWTFLFCSLKDFTLLSTRSILYNNVKSNYLKLSEFIYKTDKNKAFCYMNKQFILNILLLMFLSYNSSITHDVI